MAQLPLKSYFHSTCIPFSYLYTEHASFQTLSSTVILGGTVQENRIYCKHEQPSLITTPRICHIDGAMPQDGRWAGWKRKRSPWMVSLGATYLWFIESFMMGDSYSLGTVLLSYYSILTIYALTIALGSTQGFEVESSSPGLFQYQSHYSRHLVWSTFL